MSSPAYEFSSCQATLGGIQNGTLTVLGINSTNLATSGWIWDGPIALLNKNFPREDITAITYKGCVELCGDYTELNTPKTALGIITTWIFPLAILFSLPFESLHLRKLHGTLAAVSNWLGSPQTAMTATIFNFDQIRKCHRRAERGVREDTYYVLSCFNQFELPMRGGSLDDEFAATLVYGLFRPLRDGAANRRPGNADIEYTRQLLAALAAQLRLLRRRGVVPTMLSLGTFLVASVISIVLAYGEIVEGIDVTSMVLGLLYSWLPMLVICTIIDRNPVSSERTAELMSRWLYNVNVVRTWRTKGVANMPAPGPDGWWDNEVPPHFRIEGFIGQGRRMQYCGLVHAMLSCVKEPHRIDDAAGLRRYDELARDVVTRLDGRRPGLWYSSALRAMFLVWVPILMAFVVAFTSPTVGLGCWSGSFLVFGGLGSFSWVVSVCKKDCGPKLRGLCHAVNMLSVVFVVFITGLVLTGGMSNCYCSTTWFAYPLSGGYMTFESFEAVRAHYDVTVPWALAASVGFGLALVVFLVEIFWWVKCKHLWKTQERERPIPLDTPVRANMDWLQ
ncbi:hypothetical protein B0T17DRAFT_600607 [Bombardia bombarda]|uniref:Uncharacterized protein n=1 Tax=Bombardia bombarda TaxID=252184 RepID=A0AA40C1R9_9PEZI|nr:hypothetical protein B0T17DRAFT_600607 [Bombardia bombarda]